MKIVDQTDYSHAIHIPRKTIIMDGEFNKRESFFVERMQDGSNFNDAREKNLKNLKNINISQIPIEIHANVMPSTIINSVLKDMIARFAILNGYNVNHNIGFFHTDDMLKKSDTTETVTEEKAPVKTNKPTIASVRKEVGIIEKNRMGLEAKIRKQIIEIMNLGVMINYTKHTYSTLKINTAENMLTKFERLYQKGNIFCDLRPVSWCAKCGKSIQQKDIKYKKSPIQSTYALAKLKEENGKIKQYCDLENTYVVFSTIRPWTLTMADTVVIAKQTQYAIVEVDEISGASTRYIMADHLVDTIMNDGFFIRYRKIASFDASTLVGITLVNPIDDEKELKIAACDAKYVLVEEQTTTGINLLSKANSYLDYLIYHKIGLPEEKFKGVLDASGVANTLLPAYKGIFYQDIGKKVVTILQEKKLLFLQKDATIIIPRCKKCNEEMIYRIQNKWYVTRPEGENEKLAQVFENLLLKTNTSNAKDAKKLKMSLDKILSLKQLSISNEHKCNAPIPAFTCAQCGHVIINEITIAKCKKIIKESGIDAWNKMTPEEILTGEVKCEKCDCDFLFKEDNSMNDSFKLLTTPMFQIDKLPNHPDYKAKINVNLCIENRKSFLDKIKVSSFDEKAALKINSITKVMIHPKLQEIAGIVGKEKEEKFTISDLVKKYSIDILRLWAIYRSNKESIRLTEGDIINIRRIYVKFRKTIKYILSNLYDFNPKKDRIDVSKREDLDQYLYYKMQKIKARLDGYYGSLNFRGIYKTLFVFCVNTLEENYFEAIKFNLYITKANSTQRRSAQSTLYDLFELFILYLEPILPLLFEESWPYIQHYSPEEEHNLLLYRRKQDLKQLNLTPSQQVWEKIFLVKKKITPFINQALNSGMIKNPLEASLMISCNEESVNFIKDNYENLVRALGVSEVKATIHDAFQVEVTHAVGVACAKCHNYSVNIGLDYEYRHLCPICAEMEAHGEDPNFIRKTFLTYPRAKEQTKDEANDQPISPVKEEPVYVPSNFEDDRMGGDFDDYTIDPSKVTVPVVKEPPIEEKQEEAATVFETPTQYVKEVPQVEQEADTTNNPVYEDAIVDATHDVLDTPAVTVVPPIQTPVQEETQIETKREENTDVNKPIVENNEPSLTQREPKIVEEPVPSISNSIERALYQRQNTSNNDSAAQSNTQTSYQISPLKKQTYAVNKGIQNIINRDLPRHLSLPNKKYTSIDEIPDVIPVPKTESVTTSEPKDDVQRFLEEQFLEDQKAEAQKKEATPTAAVDTPLVLETDQEYADMQQIDTKTQETNSYDIPQKHEFVDTNNVYESPSLSKDSSDSVSEKSEPIQETTEEPIIEVVPTPKIPRIEIDPALLHDASQDNTSSDDTTDDDSNSDSVTPVDQQSDPIEETIQEPTIEVVPTPEIPRIEIDPTLLHDASEDNTSSDNTTDDDSNSDSVTSVAQQSDPIEETIEEPTIEVVPTPEIPRIEIDPTLLHDASQDNTSSDNTTDDDSNSDSVTPVDQQSDPIEETIEEPTIEVVPTPEIPRIEIDPALLHDASEDNTGSDDTTDDDSNSDSVTSVAQQSVLIEETVEEPIIEVVPTPEIPRIEIDPTLLGIEKEMDNVEKTPTDTNDTGSLFTKEQGDFESSFRDTDFDIELPNINNEQESSLPETPIASNHTDIEEMPSQSIEEVSQKETPIEPIHDQVNLQQKDDHELERENIKEIKEEKPEEKKPEPSYTTYNDTNDSSDDEGMGDWENSFRD